MNGFDQDEGGGESKEGTEVAGGLLAPHDEVAESPVPDKIQELLRQLDAAEERQSDLRKM